MLASQNVSLWLRFSECHSGWDNYFFVKLVKINCEIFINIPSISRKNTKFKVILVSRRLSVNTFNVLEITFNWFSYIVHSISSALSDRVYGSLIRLHIERTIIRVNMNNTSFSYHSSSEFSEIHCTKN